MIVLLSGEGSSDLGQCSNAQGECRSPEFVHGPMTLLVDRVVGDRLQYSLLDVPGSYVYLAEKRLQEREEARRQERNRVSFVGKKRGQETGNFYINAWMLGEEAIRLRQNTGDDVIAILFRDCDGTRSAVKGIWDQKMAAIAGGFARSGLGELGVPMVPKPKSEAWMLCAARPVPYVNCSALEDRSGNDNSPRNLKDELSEALGGGSTRQDQVDWLEAHGFDQAAVAAQMSSFGAFKGRLEAALVIVMGGHRCD